MQFPPCPQGCIGILDWQDAVVAYDFVGNCEKCGLQLTITLKPVDSSEE